MYHLDSSCIVFLMLTTNVKPFTYGIKRGPHCCCTTAKICDLYREYCNHNKLCSEICRTISPMDILNLFTKGNLPMMELKWSSLLCLKPYVTLYEVLKPIKLDICFNVTIWAQYIKGNRIIPSDEKRQYQRHLPDCRSSTFNFFLEIMSQLMMP